MDERAYFKNIDKFPELKEPYAYNSDVQKHNLREFIKKRLFWILYSELGFLVGIIIFQGFNIWGFKLNEYVFGVFTSAVLIQTFFLLRYVVRYSFDLNGSS